VELETPHTEVTELLQPGCRVRAASDCRTSIVGRISLLEILEPWNGWNR
jgi:hypothetical protein